MGKEKEKILLAELDAVFNYGISRNRDVSHSMVLLYGDSDQLGSQLGFKLWEDKKKEESAQKELYNFIQIIINDHEHIMSEINKIWIIPSSESSVVKRLLRTSMLTSIPDIPPDPKLLETIKNAMIIDKNTSIVELIKLCIHEEVFFSGWFLGKILIDLASKLKGYKIFEFRVTPPNMFIKEPKRFLQIAEELQRIKLIIHGHIKK